MLEELFGARLIGLDSEKFTGHGIDWPPYSTDLNPCDSFLWGYLKDNVYSANPRTILELKEKITLEISQISGETLAKVSDAFENRLRSCTISSGENFENLLY